tara:strand:- start:977 stop:1315 length:339 start_codon:yes stop_codon:yes gene_type:complete
MRNTGICDAVEKYLKEHGERCYSDICLGMQQYSSGGISGALSTLKRENRIVSLGQKKNAIYKVRHWTKETPTGLRKYIPVFRPLKPGNLFAKWDLCVRLPHDPERDLVRLVR